MRRMGYSGSPKAASGSYENSGNQRTNSVSDKISGIKRKGESSDSVLPQIGIKRDSLLGNQPPDGSWGGNQESESKVSNEIGGVHPPTIFRGLENSNSLVSSEDTLPHGFPTNAESLFLTGILDGCPVFYLDLEKREKKWAIILKDHYLCSCGDCRFLRPVTGAEFLHHFGATFSCPPELLINFSTAISVQFVILLLPTSHPATFFNTLASLTGASIKKQNFWNYWKRRNYLLKFWDYVLEQQDPCLRIESSCTA